jgi:LPLT family lysophospholipid transporter-like MFS transporter
MRSQSLWSRAMIGVMIAQFFSALADNALLFAAIGLLKQQHAPDWITPLLQEAFVLSYIVLAPFVGPLADAVSKGRVMLFANALKLFGAAAMLAGVNPLLSYGLVGAGAAAYSPAKYGILSELVEPEHLVKANGMMEGSTIAAILIGAISGGVLADRSISLALGCVCAAYVIAALANLMIPKMPQQVRAQSFSVVYLVKDFWKALSLLFRDPDARFSLLGTSLFWGTGSTLRFMLVAWAAVALSLTSNSAPAYLNAVVAVGITIGAVIAAKFIPLSKIHRALPAGVAIGLLVMALMATHSVSSAVVVLGLLGACGGAYVVPLNALLQERGHDTVGAGRAVAVQNFAENILMLLMIGGYTIALRAGVGIQALAIGFGAALTVATAVLAFFRRRNSQLVRESCAH